MPDNALLPDQTIRFPLPLWGILIRRAQARGYRQHATALAQVARFVEQTGVPQARGRRQDGRAA